MRVTENMTAARVLFNLQEAGAKMSRYQEQLATGKRLAVPSDDPVAVVSSMRLRSALTEAERYGRNVEQAINWLAVTDTALGSAVGLVQRVRELTLQGATDVMPAPSREALATQVEGLADQLVQVANTAMDGRYIFSGQRTTVVPFARLPDGTVAYQGDVGILQREIGMDTTIRTNVTGDVVFEPVFTVLEAIRDDLLAGETARLSSTRVAELDAALDGLLAVRAEVGTKINRLEYTRDRLQDVRLNLEDLVSKGEDADMAEVLIRLSSLEAAYRAALAAGARILQPSLLDFLR